MAHQPPLTQVELAFLRLQALNQLAATERAQHEPAQPLDQDPQTAISQLRAVEAQEKAAQQPYLGQLSELVNQLRHEKPDIIGQVQSQLKTKRSFWQRLRLTLGLD